MSESVYRVAARTRSFPRTLVVVGFLMVSGLAQLQTVVDLHPAPQQTSSSSAGTGLGRDQPSMP